MALGLNATITESVRTATTDPWTFNYTPDATPRAIILSATHGTSSTDHVVGVTYGGDAMTRVIRATDTSTEPGASELWFLGTSIPTGTQTVSVDLASATGDDIQFVVWSLTAAADTEVIDSDSISENAANPTRTLQKGGRSGFCVASMYGGGAAPGGTLETGNTLGPTEDHTAFYSQTCYETTIDTSDHTIGWSTLGTDDLAFVAICVAEVGATHALAADFPLGLTVDTAVSPVVKVLAADFPLGLGIATALQPVEKHLAADFPLGLTLDTALTRETFAAASEALAFAIATELTLIPGLTEHFIAADFPLGLQIDTALTRETFLALSEALNLQVGTALTRETFLGLAEALNFAIATQLQRETFVALAQEFGLTVDSAISRETFLAVAEQFGLEIATNLAILTSVASASLAGGPKENLQWL